MKIAWWPRNWLVWGAVSLVVIGVAIRASADWLPLMTEYKRNLAAGMLQLVLITLATGCFAAWWGGHSRWEVREDRKSTRLNSSH